MGAYLGAFLFGVTLAIAIGPIALLIIRAGIERGFAAAARCGLGAATADLLYALLAFSAGAALLPRLTRSRGTIELAASLVLVALGLWLAAQGLRPAQPGGDPAPWTLRPGFLSTLSLTLLNPLTVLLFAGLTAQLGLAGDALEVLGYALAVFSGSLVVQLALGAFGALLHLTVRSPRALATLNVASGLAIAAFGVRGLLAQLR